MRIRQHGMILMLLIFGLHGSGQTAATAKSPGTTTFTYETAANDPLNARVYTLKNGLKVYLSVYKQMPRIQTFIAVRAGSKNDPADATGLAHYLEHMIFKGTDKFGTRNWQKESVEIKKIEDLYEVYRKTTDATARKKIYHQIDSISGVAAQYAIANEYDKMLAAIGADGTNAYTSYDQTVYVNDIPSNQIDSWLKIESERFRKLVLRLFHTELEAVYEEKNRNLDSDSRKVWEELMSGLFSKHTYGTQTTIGTIDHLKNPSLVEINKYFDKHYIPNNMAIVMSGDFDPDKVIVQIEKYFGGFKPKPVDAFQFEPEAPIKGKIVKEVVGPDPSSVNMAWRFPGTGTKEADVCALISEMLYNNTAGLLDLNLNQAQKVLKSDALFWPLRDYGLFGISGEPKEGQSLEEIEQLLLSQIDALRKGNFPDWLPQAVVTNMKLNHTRSLEDNYSRADEMLDAFIGNLKWQDQVEELDRLSKISRQEIIDFANRNLSTADYVVVYKRTGTDSSVKKVDKPEITPVNVDRENASPFAQQIMKATPPPIEPKYLDYEKDIVKIELRPGLQLLYNKNTENKLFELTFLFNVGSDQDKVLPVALKYLPYLATSEMSGAKIKEEFYKLGCSYDVYGATDETHITLTGLSENMESALQLFEKMLSEPLVEEIILKNLKSDILKERADRKLQKRVILSEALANYGLYGPRNPFSNVLNDEELNRLSVQNIAEKIKSLLAYQHRVLYYGPLNEQRLAATLKAYHRTAEQLLPPPPPVKYELKAGDKTVYVANYDMKQVEIMLLSPGTTYEPAKEAITRLYNNYFGTGMNSVVFQDLRESRALAYSTYSRYQLPDKLYKKGFNHSYIGSQSDKLADALKGLSDLLKEMPRAENNFLAAKEAVLQEIRTQRITRSGVLYNYLDAQDLGLSSDIRKDIFEKVKRFTYADIKKFHEENVKNKPTTYLVLGKVDELDLKALEKYGQVKIVDLKEIFGY